MMAIRCKTQSTIWLRTPRVHVVMGWQMMLTNQRGFSQDQAWPFQPPSSFQWLFRVVWLRNHGDKRHEAQPNPTCSGSPPPLCRSISLKRFQISLGGKSATLWHGALLLMAGNELSLRICHWTNGASTVVVCTCVRFCLSVIFFLP